MLDPRSGTAPPGGAPHSTPGPALGYGEDLYRALALRGHGFDGARSGWDAAVLATHPHTELRLERLEGTGRDYHLPYDSVPPEPVTALPRSRRRGPDKD